MKMLLPTIAVVVFMLAIMTMGSFSYFTSSVSNNPTITMGTLTLRIRPDASGSWYGSISPTISPCAPSHVYYYSFQIWNKGSLKGNVKVAITNVPSAFGVQAQYFGGSWHFWTGAGVDMNAGAVLSCRLRVVIPASVGDGWQGASFYPKITFTATNV